MPSPTEILAAVLAAHAPDDRWAMQPFARIKQIQPKIGDVGQEFVERLCAEIGFACEFPVTADGRRTRMSPWDIRIEGKTFEIKTATEGDRGTFQFNHIRYHRDYEALLCIGIAPASIHMGAWTKADVTTGKAGRLVTMERGANASFKLTKRTAQLLDIREFEARIMDICTAPGAPDATSTPT